MNYVDSYDGKIQYLTDMRKILVALLQDFNFPLPSEPFSPIDAIIEDLARPRDLEK